MAIGVDQGRVAAFADELAAALGMHTPPGNSIVAVLYVHPDLPVPLRHRFLVCVSPVHLA